jgi:D-galactarolactone cycloisomerase
MASPGVRHTVTTVTARSFTAKAPSASAFAAPVRFAASSQPVHGYLVGVSDGACCGWWGPVTEDVALGAVRLFSRVRVSSAATPAQWAARLRRGTRHSHAGTLAVSIGAFELACWDLLGQMYGVPVWRLFVSRPLSGQIGSYATCFGVRLDQLQAPDVVAQVGQVWQIQKWRPVRRMLRNSHPAARAVEAAGPERVALDFGGVWPLGSVLRFCSLLGMKLAWIEEPCPPGELITLSAGPRPARFAAGEHCYNSDDIAALATADVDIWQPDAVFCGGFSSLRGIAATAVARCRMLFPHGGGMVPALHAAVAGSVVSLIEFHLLLELRRQVHLAEPLIPHCDGQFPVPELPGWAGPLRPGLW